MGLPPYGSSLGHPIDRPISEGLVTLAGPAQCAKISFPPLEVLGAALASLVLGVGGPRALLVRTAMFLGYNTGSRKDPTYWCSRSADGCG